MKTEYKKGFIVVKNCYFYKSNLYLSVEYSSSWRFLWDFNTFEIFLRHVLGLCVFQKDSAIDKWEKSRTGSAWRGKNVQECRLKVVKVTKATRSGFTVSSLLILAVSKIDQSVLRCNIYSYWFKNIKLARI